MLQKRCHSPFAFCPPAPLFISFNTNSCPFAFGHLFIHKKETFQFRRFTIFDGFLKWIITYLDFFLVSGTKYFNKNWTNYVRFSFSVKSAYLPKIRQTCLFFWRKIDGNRKRKWHCWFSPPTFWPMVGKMMVEKYANVSPLVTFDMGWKSSKHVWSLGPHQEAAAFNGTNHDHHENFGKNSIWHPKQSCFGNIFNWFRLEFLSWLPNRLRSFPNKDDAMMLCAKKTYQRYQRHFKVAPWKIQPILFFKFRGKFLHWDFAETE